jgi:hypothetical protein
LPCLGVLHREEVAVRTGAQVGSRTTGMAVTGDLGTVGDCPHFHFKSSSDRITVI